VRKLVGGCEECRRGFVEVRFVKAALESRCTHPHGPEIDGSVASVQNRLLGKSRWQTLP
jgi:hypothetical protein